MRQRTEDNTNPITRDTCMPIKCDGGGSGGQGLSKDFVVLIKHQCSCLYPLKYKSEVLDVATFMAAIE